jgi:low affinity Fe/Cu permease
LKDVFRQFATATAEAGGSPWTFLAAVAIVVVWGISGPLFGFSDTWQLVINTGTTIVTFLMVFLVQNTQNRDARAIHLKLDELLRAVQGARTGLVNLEALSDEDLHGLQRQFERLASSNAAKAVEYEVKSEAVQQVKGRRAKDQPARSQSRKA